MSRTMSIGFTLGGYLLFGIVAFLIFLYQTFPFDLAQDAMVRSFEAKSGCKTEVGRKTQAFPIKLAWHDIQLHCLNIPSLPFETFQTDFSIRPLLFQSHKEATFHLQMPANMGEMTGDITREETPEGPAYTLKDEGKNINLYPLGLQGILHTQGNGRWTGEDPLAGVGSRSITLEGVRIELLERGSPFPWISTLSAITPLIGVSAISVETLKGEIEWKKRTLLIKTLYADGEIAKIENGTGTLEISEPFSKSTVSLTLEVVPRGNLKQMASLMVPHYSDQTPLTFVVSGMVSSPSISVNGMRLPSVM